MKGLIGLCLKYLPGGRYAPHHPDKRKYRDEVKEQKKYKKLYAVKSKAYKRLKRHYNKLVNKEEDPVKKIMKRKAKIKQKKLSSAKLWELRIESIGVKRAIANMENELAETGDTDWKNYERQKKRLEYLRAVCNK